MNKKIIKEFLKPTKKKILLFVILGIIFSFFPIIHCTIYYHALPLGEQWSQTTICFPFECLLDVILLKEGGGFSDCSWSSIGLIYFSIYIFSCLIISTYTEIKTKNKN